MTIGAIVCVLIGVAMLVYGLYQRSRMRASQNWAEAMGTITAAEIRLQTDSEGSRSYSLSVAYGYQVNGAVYTGKRIGFGSRTYTRKKSAEAELARYPVNSTVIVFFDPQKPADAVLTREAPSSTLMIVLGAGLLVLGVILFALGQGRND